MTKTTYEILELPSLNKRLVYAIVRKTESRTTLDGYRFESREEVEDIVKKLNEVKKYLE